MPRITLDAAELAELLQLLAGWLTADPARLAPSLLAYIGHPAYGLDTLRADLDRFTFLLGFSEVASGFRCKSAGVVPGSMVMLGDGCDSFWLVAGAGAGAAVPGMRAHLAGCPACRDDHEVRGCRPGWRSGASRLLCVTDRALPPV